MTIVGTKRMIVYNDLEPAEKLKIYDRGITVNHDPEQQTGRDRCEDLHHHGNQNDRKKFCEAPPPPNDPPPPEKPPLEKPPPEM